MKTIQNGPLFLIFKRSSSIHKNNPALVASIVLKKIYFHGICELSKKYIEFHAFLCLRSKSQILRVKNVKKQNLTHPKAAKLATLSLTDTRFLHLIDDVNFQQHIFLTALPI